MWVSEFIKGGSGEGGQPLRVVAQIPFRLPENVLKTAQNNLCLGDNPFMLENPFLFLSSHDSRCRIINPQQTQR